ncbi:hypothetical protein [Campylobacter sp. CCUG 57310]|uniref:OB-fold protein n=1 Tax=Campylobacter sp. CCUG 57310 TaxID=2517362 RepID=UPI0015664672|nr:hypothetical protein [Campylobacter sp. CCUG 57310]QKF92181.1 hypothetical protein CORI_0984 [Campylobacter sp. CCUG 57310]
MRSFYKYPLMAIAAFSFAGCSMQEASNNILETSKKVRESISQVGQTSSSDDALSKEVIDLTTSKICKAWKENEVAANKEYLYKNVRLKGKLTQITQGGTRLESGKDSITYITNYDNDELAKLKKGNTYQVVGEIKSIGHNFSTISGCDIALRGNLIAPSK